MAIMGSLVISACSSTPPLVEPVRQAGANAAQAETPDLAAIKAENEAAMTLYLGCIAKEAKRLDDRTSDPASIASGIISSCGVQFNAAANTYSRHSGGDYLQTRRQVETSLRQSSSDFAIRMILENRAKAAKRPAHSTSPPK